MTRKWNRKNLRESISGLVPVPIYQTKYPKNLCICVLHIHVHTYIQGLSEADVETPIHTHVYIHTYLQGLSEGTPKVKWRRGKTKCIHT